MSNIAAIPGVTLTTPVTTLVTNPNPNTLTLLTLTGVVTGVLTGVVRVTPVIAAILDIY